MNEFHKIFRHKNTDSKRNILRKNCTLWLKSVGKIVKFLVGAKIQISPRQSQIPRFSPTDLSLAAWPFHDQIQTYPDFPETAATHFLHYGSGRRSCGTLACRNSWTSNTNPPRSLSYKRNSLNGGELKVIIQVHRQRLRCSGNTDRRKDAFACQMDTTNSTRYRPIYKFIHTWKLQTLTLKYVPLLSR